MIEELNKYDIALLEAALIQLERDCIENGRKNKLDVSDTLKTIQITRKKITLPIEEFDEKVKESILKNRELLKTLK